MKFCFQNSTLFPVITPSFNDKSCFSLKKIAFVSHSQKECNRLEII